MATFAPLPTSIRSYASAFAACCGSQLEGRLTRRWQTGQQDTARAKSSEPRCGEAQLERRAIRRAVGRGARNAQGRAEGSGGGRITLVTGSESLGREPEGADTSFQATTCGRSRPTGLAEARVEAAIWQMRQGCNSVLGRASGCWCSASRPAKASMVVRQTSATERTRTPGDRFRRVRGSYNTSVGSDGWPRPCVSKNTCQTEVWLERTPPQGENENRARVSTRARLRRWYPVDGWASPP